MTLDKAIEIKEVYHKKYRVHMLSEEREADNLSIEALKFHKICREHKIHFATFLLPGETKD